VGLIRIAPKAHRDMYGELVFLRPVRAPGHVAHSGAFGASNIDALLLMLGLAPVRISQKARQDMLCQTCVFGSSGIGG
jgi:hypothetical protein